MDPVTGSTTSSGTGPGIAEGLQYKQDVQSMKSEDKRN